MLSAAQAWQAVLGQLQMEMAKATFDTWAKGTFFVSYKEGVYTVGVNNAFARDWLDSRLNSTVVRMLSGILNRSVEVEFIVQKAQAETVSEPEEDNRLAAVKPNPAADLAPFETSLNTNYKFDNFVVGASNRLAHAASLAVSEQPAKAYNPLFLYGGVGLGKTHLLHAIGHECAKKNLVVLYVSSEEFTNDLISSIRSHQTRAFRDKYRNIDVLLVDDIQFIAGKESTQEEFFHTFNTLHNQNKQIVLTSDRSPREIKTLEDRLRSRFEWGLIADIQPPSLETRIAILQSKAKRKGQEVPAQILEAIAFRMQSNIRELEGALNRIVAYSDLRGLPLTTDLLDSVLIDLMPRRQQPAPERILKLVADSYNLSVDQIINRNRARHVAIPRQVAMYLLREEAKISLPQIGKVLGDRDHTTVMHGCNKIASMLEEDEQVRDQVHKIRNRLGLNA